MVSDQLQIKGIARLAPSKLGTLFAATLLTPALLLFGIQLLWSLLKMNTAHDPFLYECLPESNDAGARWVARFFAFTGNAQEATSRDQTPLNNPLYALQL